MYERADSTDREHISVVSTEAVALSHLKEQLHGIYVGIDVKTTSDKELVIQFVGDEEYFYSVKKDLERVIDKVIKTPALSEYTVVFHRWEFIEKSK